MSLRFATVAVCFAFLLSAFAAAQEHETPTALPAGEAPPWTQDASEPARLPLRDLAGPREFLELLNIDASQLGRFADRRPLHPDEYEPLYRILYRIPRFERDELLRWRLRDVDWSEFAEHPEERRAASLRLTGRVTRIEKEALLPEAAQVLEFDHFYRVSLQADDAPFPALVCSRWLPQAWKLDREVDYRASVDGLFLKLGETEEGSPQLIVACQRVAWHPDRPDPELGVTEDHVLLASRGMDLGQFDLVRDRTAITARERECFYQMLDAVRRIDPQSFTRRTATEDDLGPLLGTPRMARGRQTAFVGQARRVQEIRVNERDIRERFSIDHYYEIDVFTPLERHAIKMGEGENAPVFDQYYPVIFCVAELPQGMAPEDVVDRQVRIPAFSFKLWAYKTEFMRRHGDRSEQLSPMLIGRTVEVLPPPESPFASVGTFAVTLFVITLAAACLWVWRMNRQDAAFGRQERRRRHRVDEKQPLDNLQAQEPDFSNLESDDKA